MTNISSNKNPYKKYKILFFISATYLKLFAQGGGGGAENRPTPVSKKELDNSKFVDLSFKAQTHVLKSYKDITRVVFEIQVLKIR